MAKIKDVAVGQIWRCKVSGRVVNVRVDAVTIDQGDNYYGRRRKTTISLTNLRTGNRVSRSAAALRVRLAYPSGPQSPGEPRLTPRPLSAPSGMVWSVENEAGGGSRWVLVSA